MECLGSGRGINDFGGVWKRVALGNMAFGYTRKQKGLAMGSLCGLLEVGWYCESINIM